MTTKIKISADNYKKFTHREHVYNVPDTYVGSVRPMERVEWLLKPDSNSKGQKYLLTAEQKQIKFPVGAERIFIEVLSNAGDNVPRSLAQGMDPGTIEVIMDETTVVVKNGGCPIPIEINTQTGELAPCMIFGSLLTSSNYEGDREGAGRNGI